MIITKFLLGVVVALLFSLNGTAPTIAAEYVAKVYPGTKADQTKAETAGAMAFYTNDPVEKVLDFYNQRPDRAEEVYSNGAYIEYLTADAVSDIYRKKKIMSEAGYASGRSMGVTISALRLPKPDEMPSMSSATMVLTQMDGQFEAWGHSKDELAAVHNKYDHLVTALYMMSDKKDNAGKRLDQGWVLANAFTAELNKGLQGGASNAADIGKKMQDAAARGDIQELSRLAAMMEGSSNQMEQEDHWDAGVKALAEMNKISYRTRIVISEVP